MLLQDCEMGMENILIIGTCQTNTPSVSLSDHPTFGYQGLNNKMKSLNWNAEELSHIRAQQESMHYARQQVKPWLCLDL